MPHTALLRRIRAEYLEMPGLRLTLTQAQRLCGVDRATCQRVLDELVEARFLCVKRDGAYARVTEGQMPASATGDASTAATAREGKSRRARSHS
jgi:hypothetical protein